MFPLLLVIGLSFSTQTQFAHVIPNVKATGILVDARVGRIDVRATSEPALKVKANVPVTVEPDGTGLRIRATEPRKIQEVNIEVLVPRAMLVRATGSATDVSIAGIDGNIRVDVHQGVVEVRGGTGASDIDVVNGQVSISDRTGTVAIMAAASGVRLTNLSGSIKVDGTSGDITLTDTRSASIDAQTVSGEIRFAGTVAAGGRYNFASHSGGVRVAIPQGAGATFTLLTANSVVETTPTLSPISVEPGKLTKRVYRIGNATGQIEIRSISGKVVLNWSGK